MAGIKGQGHSRFAMVVAMNRERQHRRGPIPKGPRTQIIGP